MTWAPGGVFSSENGLQITIAETSPSSLVYTIIISIYLFFLEDTLLKTIYTPTSLKSWVNNVRVQMNEI